MKANVVLFQGEFRLVVERFLLNTLGCLYQVAQPSRVKLLNVTFARISVK